MLAGFLRGHGARLQHQDAGDDLKAVADTVLPLPEQRLPQQFFLLAFDGPPLGDILESKKKGRARVIRVEHRAGVQEHDAAANPGKLMLDLERVHGGALRDDFLQKLAKSWNVPLTIAERVEWPAQNFLAVDPERQVVGAADGEHAEVAVKHEQGFAHRVHDGLREGPRILDVLERRLNHAMNAPEPFSFLIRHTSRIRLFSILGFIIDYGMAPNTPPKIPRPIAAPGSPP